MATGTGLPIPKEAGDLVQQPSAVISAEKWSLGAFWGSIAQSGAKIAEAGLREASGIVAGNLAVGRAIDNTVTAGTNIAAKAIHENYVGYIADEDNEIRRTRLELRDKHANDPPGFDNAWQSYSEGKLAKAQPQAVRYLKNKLADEGNAAYSGILSERRAFDHRQNAERMSFRIKSAENDVIGSAMAGQFQPDGDGDINLRTYQNILAAAVSTNLITREEADFRVDDLRSRAVSEVAAREGVGVYRERGLQEAVDHLRTRILENEGISLSSQKRNAAFNRGVSAINLAAKEDRQARGEIVQDSRAMLDRIKANEDVSGGEVNDMLGSLRRVGALSAHLALAKAYGVATSTAAYRSGAMTIGQLGGRVADFRGQASPQVMQSITDAAAARGVDPGYMIAAAKRESQFDPNARADTSSATGLFQFVDQTWLAQFAKDGAAAGHADLAGKIIQQGGRYYVADEAARSQILNLRRDPTTAAKMMASFTADNRDHLRGVLGREPNAGELYAAHFLGREGAASLLTANPGDIASRLFPAAAASNRSIFYDRGGSARTVAEVTRNLTGLAVPSGDAGALPIEHINRGVQEFFVGEARKAWPNVKELISKGRIPDAEDFAAIHYAATVSGNAAWAREINTFAAVALLGQQGETMTEAQKEQALTDIYKTFEKANWSGASSDAFDAIQKTYERQSKWVRDDPITFGVRTNQFKQPQPLNLSSPEAARAGVDERIKIARGVAERQGTPLGVPFTEGDRAAIGAALRGGNAQQAGIAAGVLTSLPDDLLRPVLGAADIKDALKGAMRSKDPARFNAAMSVMNKIWERAPQDFANTFGTDAMHDLMTWQEGRRYRNPAEIADELQRLEDPQVRQQREREEAKGRELATKTTFDKVVAGFDESSFFTPGIIARNVTGSQPLAPTDAETRRALKGDYTETFQRRYADTLDADKAHEQTMKMLKTRWHRSEINGGKLMLQPPEHYYPAIDGDHKWMRAQIETELTSIYGKREIEPGLMTAEETATGVLRPPAAWSYALVSDRVTEADVQAGRPPRYKVVVTDHRTGRTDTMMDETGTKPRMFWWDTGAAEKAIDDGAWERQRARVNAPYLSVSGTPRGMFDPNRQQ